MMDWRYNALDALARSKPMPGGGADARTAVVFSPGHLGDILHAVPMLKALRAGKPGTRIIWLVGPWSEALAQRYARYVDDIRIFGPNLTPYTRGKREWRQSAWTQWRLALALRREGVECLIAPGNGVGRFLANAICPDLWIGIGEWRPPRVRPEIQTHFQRYEKARYEADALAGLLNPLGIEARAERLEYVVTAEEQAAAARFFAAEGVDSSRRLALLAPGSGWSGKNWLPERLGEVARWLATERGFQVAWVGGAGEATLVPKTAAGDFNWVGKTELFLLAAMMERAQLFVGNDGGLLHFAAALDVPTVSVWGPTHPGKWGPQGAIHRQIRNVEHCEGCIYWDYRESCRHDRACMKAITVAEVQQAIRDVLPA